MPLSTLQEAPWLLTVPYYVEEVAALVDALKLDEYYLYGSSWGSCLAQEVAVTQPRGLAGIILDGTLADGETYITTQWRDRISTLPEYTQKLLKQLEADQAHESETYKEIEKVLTSHFTTRLVPKPQCYLDCLAAENKKIYVAMQGPSEFTLGGVLKNWSILDRLYKVECPALVLRGEFDTMTEECHQQVVDHIPYAWPCICIPRAAHCKLLDEPQLCCKATFKFLETVHAMRCQAAGGSPRGTKRKLSCSKVP